MSWDKRREGESKGERERGYSIDFNLKTLLLQLLASANANITMEIALNRRKS